MQVLMRFATAMMVLSGLLGPAIAASTDPAAIKGVLMTDGSGSHPPGHHPAAPPRH